MQQGCSRLAWPVSIQPSREAGWSSCINEVFCRSGCNPPLHCSNLEAAVQRHSGRARRKTPKKHGNMWHTPVTGLRQTKQELFAWFISARRSARAARFGAAAEAPSHTCLSYLRTLCSRVAAALAAQFSCEAAGAGYAASSAAHAAKPHRVSSGGIPKSAMDSRSSFNRVPHRSKKVCFLPQQHLLCLCSGCARQTDALMI